MRCKLLVLPLLALVAPTVPPASAAPPDPQAPLPTSVGKRAPSIRRDAERTLVATAEALVAGKLIAPLANKEAGRVRFSRVYLPPQARRVRILERERFTDLRGHEFVRFAIDERSRTFSRKASAGSEHWRTDAIVGCAYLARQEVFIKRGEAFFGVDLLLGKRTPADDQACRPADAHLASR